MNHPTTESIADTITRNILFRSGRSFTIDDLQRSQYQAKKLGHSRIRQVLNKMVEDGEADKIEDGDFIAYRKRTSSRYLLCSLWANVTPDLEANTPRWR